MATMYEVMCINKSNRMSRHERIHKIGGTVNRIPWRKTQEEAIAEIKAEKSEFYVNVNGNVAKVIVETNQWGNDYLKTEADSTLVDNLLSLPECN